jgi:hypothetical protein
VNREQVEALAAQGVAVRASALGTTIELDGEDITAVVSLAAPDLNLEAGGFEKPVAFVVRIAKTDLATAPTVGTAVVIDSSTYRITSVHAGDSPLAQDWVLEVSAK